MTDPNAEEAILACMMIDGGETVAKAIAAGASSLWFSTASHAALFRRLCNMFIEGKPVDDTSLVVTELTAHRELEEVGGVAGLLRISSAAPTTAGFRTHLARIRTLHSVRQASQEVDRLKAALAQPGPASIGELLDNPVARLLSISSEADVDSEPAWAEVVEGARDWAEGAMAGSSSKGGEAISWPWPSMDDLFEPMRRGQLVTIGARPSIGKSSLVRQVVDAAAGAGHRCYLAPLEVEPKQVALSLAASRSRVGVRDLAKASDGDKRAFRQEFDRIKGYRLAISSRDRTTARIVAKLRGLAASRDGLALAAIDHGGLVRDVFEAPSGAERQAAISHLTKTLKSLAVDLGIVVVLLWQLNRASAADGNREPRLFDLRDSGSIEEDSDKVILIHRPGEDPISKMRQSETDSKADRPRFFQNVIQAKGRDDGTSSMSFYFTRATASFIPAEKPSESPQTF